MEANKLKIYYRISESGYQKVKPSYINNENCLSNFVDRFDSKCITIIADNISVNTYNMILKYVPKEQIEICNIGNGALTFQKALNFACKLEDDVICYFVENDYVHKSKSYDVLMNGFDIGFDYITLYDHPDKYILPIYGGNKFCLDGSEETRVYFSKFIHWKLTNSTTFTFAGKVSTIKSDYEIFNKYTTGYHPETNHFTGHPYDFSMWLDLRNLKNRTLGSPIPAYATHGETRWLAHCTNWGEEIKNKQYA